MTKNGLSTSQLGDWAEARVLAELFRHGFEVVRPASPASRFDLGVVFGTTIIRIQVKIATLENGTVSFMAASSKRPGAGREKKNSKRAYVGLCELLVCYCAGTNECYAIRPEDCTGSRTFLRLDPCRQLAKVKMAEDHRLKAVLSEFQARLDFQEEPERPALQIRRDTHKSGLAVTA